MADGLSNKGPADRSRISLLNHTRCNTGPKSSMSRRSDCPKPSTMSVIQLLRLSRSWSRYPSDA